MATYIELVDLRQDNEFQARTAVSAAITAKGIKDNPAPDPLLVEWAKRSFSDRVKTTLDAWTAALADNRSLTLDQIRQGTDAQLQSQTDQNVNKYVMAGVF